jgi:hypothetical protein
VNDARRSAKQIEGLSDKVVSKIAPAVQKVITVASQSIEARLKRLEGELKHFCHEGSGVVKPDLVAGIRRAAKAPSAPAIATATATATELSC